MRPDIRRSRKRETMTLQLPHEYAAIMDSRVEAVIETWKKVGGMDMAELLRSCYFQGLLDGANVEVSEQARAILVAKAQEQ